jgi:hypothetical protein
VVDVKAGFLAILGQSTVFAKPARAEDDQPAQSCPDRAHRRLEVTDFASAPSARNRRSVCDHGQSVEMTELDLGILIVGMWRRSSFVEP